ncbi:cytidine and deoxycytidylate deaminase [Acanthocystis turfacea Chlorella virus TN603.4.2]|nr:cytidine and deoxycytidylate deaminase [Acanthocystis turfacea Chlorella virus TN603.4.2]
MRLHEAIDEAISCAEQTNQPFRHGCVIMSGKKMVSNGFNHARRNIGTYSVHAEMDALWKLNTDAYDNLKAVIVRVSKTGRLGNSRPCTMCMAALKQHGVKTIVYSSFEGHIQMERIDGAELK